jgi:hypothetical protein
MRKNRQLFIYLQENELEIFFLKQSIYFLVKIKLKLAKEKESALTVNSFM